MRYCNYHKHSHYSNIRTLDSITKPEDYMKRAVELDHNIYSTCEHGFQGNVYETQTLCEKYNLKPIYAVEAYYTNDIEDKTNRTSYHLMLIGMTKKARFEINKILSLANTEGFYYKPRIDLKMLLSLTPEDTVVTSACVMSPLFKNELVPDNKKGWHDNFLIPVMQHFGKNFYLEVQDHVHTSQVEFNKKILMLHNKYDIPLIHGCDSHYILDEDSKYRDLFLKAKGIQYPEESGFVLDYPDTDTIYSRYKSQGVLSKEQVTEALNNTLIFENAEPIYTDKEFKIPKVPNEYIYKELGTDKYDNTQSDIVLEKIISNAWKEKKKKIKSDRKKQEYIEAIRYEMNIIKKCGMADYFILDHIINNKAVNEYDAVLTRSGRGSGVSFLINHLLGLTEVDRVKAPVRLYPTRFMSAERILNSRSLPDIDLNYADQEPVIKASKDVLGENQIYQMVAFKPMQRSSAFRLWCKAHDYDIDDYDDIGKELSDKHNKSEDIKKKYPNFATEIDESEKWFRGVIESVAPSPCSFLLLNEDIREQVGLIRVGDDTGKKKYIICCAMDGYNCDVYKYVKNDILQVTVYSIVDKVYKLIGRPIDDIATLINNCDDKVWDIYAKGLTTTINQADSDSGKQLVSRYKPKSLAEMSAWVAAIRPGFASLLDTFIERKEYSTGVKQLDELLKDSFHFMLYQESIMTYLVWLGIEEKETYDIIKKISKKKFKQEELDELKIKLKKGWDQKVGEDKGFEETWQVVNDAAKYSFNASHALSVAIDSIYGAYLKSHYPLEYFSVVFSLYSDDIERTAKLTNELPYFGIEMKNIKFGKSKADYQMDKESNSIYKGLNGVKYLNSKVADELYEISTKFSGNFVELLKILGDTSINSRQLEILIRLNFFSDFGQNKYLLDIKELFETIYSRKEFKKIELEKYNIPETLMRKFSHKETEKLFKDIDMDGLFEKLIENVPQKSLTIQEQIKGEIEYLGYVEYVNPKIDKNIYIVTDYRTYDDETRPYFSMRRCSDGEVIRTRIKYSNVYRRNPFGLFSILQTESFGCYKNKTDERVPILNNYEVLVK